MNHERSLIACLLVLGICACQQHSTDAPSGPDRKRVCDQQFELVKVGLRTAKAIALKGQDSSSTQHESAGRLMAVMAFCFEPDHDHPIDPGTVAADLDALTADQIDQLIARLQDGWDRSTVGGPWLGKTR